MKKILSITQKDLQLILRDRAALIFMLLAPLLLTFAMAAITGSFSGAGGSIQDVPVVIANLDEGEMGAAIVSAFEGEDVLFEVTTTTNEAEARQVIEDDQAAAAIFIPAGFSASLSPEGQAAPVEVYTSPNRPISASVVRSVVRSVVNQIEVLPVSVQVATQQLILNGLIQPQEAASVAGEMATRLSGGGSGRLITIDLDEKAQAQEDDFNYMTYLAPGMAIFFLMYTVTQGGRSLLAERDYGTLPRMLISPTSSAEILGGKLLSIFVTGFLQVSVLVLVSSLIFNLKWGDPLGVTLLIAAVALAATGWGILLASVVKTPFQASSLGSALMLIFGVLGGAFISIDVFSDAMRLLSKITPHAWALDGFVILGTGGSLAEALPDVGALLAMSALLFVAAAVVARKRWASGFLR
jgi:ABC-2 type transport system permease protein